MQYVRTPQSISTKDLIGNKYCYAPSKYSAFHPKDKSKFEILARLVDPKNQRESVQKDRKYQYVEIGDVNVDTGAIDYEEIFGVHVPSSKPLKVERGDILVSTVRTYRKGIGYVDSTSKNIVATPAFLVFNNIKRGLTAEYLLAILRSDFFVEQILSFQNRGMYPRLDSETIHEVYIPIPNKKELAYLSTLQRALINKEAEIRKKHAKITILIEREILDNQRSDKFTYKDPTISELKRLGRFDAGYYSEPYKYKQFLIRNYVHSTSTVKDLGYKIKRGQNLQESAIGKITESDTSKPGFYTVIRPTDLSDLGTVLRYGYLGNPNSLSTLGSGDIVFSAEGTIGKCVLFVSPNQKAITNIHGIILYKDNYHIDESAFISCFLRFLRHWRIFDYISVGGQGGSLAMQYWDDIHIPNFSTEKRMEIARLYCNEPPDKAKLSDMDSFVEDDALWNQKAGIVQIDESAKEIGLEIKEFIHKLVLG